MQAPPEDPAPAARGPAQQDAPRPAVEAGRSALWLAGEPRDGLPDEGTESHDHGLAGGAAPPRGGGWRAQFRRRRGAIAPFALVVCAFVPLVVDNSFHLRILTLSWLLGALTAGLALSLGYAGIFNMSQGTFYGLGAYTSAILVTDAGLPYEVTILASFAVAGVAGIVIGLTTRRIRGDYWALVSMAFTVGVIKLIENWRPVTGGMDGYVGIPVVTLFGIRMDSATKFYFAALGVLALALLVAWRITRSFVGRAMLAVRFDENAASAMGVSPLYFKLLAMGVGSGLAGVAGAMLVAVTGFIHPNDFGLIPSFNITLFAIVGGVTSLFGGVVAATVLTVVTEQFRSLTDYRLLIYGSAVVLAIFVRAGVFSALFARLTGRASRRPEARDAELS